MHPGALSVPARGGETLLEAGLRAGLTLPYDCRSGGCGVCVCTVLAGRVAGATGFVPIKSIVEDAFRRGIRRPMWLYRPDLYMADLAERWAREHENFHFVPVLSDAPADADWNGRRGPVHEAMLADFPDLRGYELYACGSLHMIETAVPALLAQGLDEQHCHSDALVPTVAP